MNPGYERFELELPGPAPLQGDGPRTLQQLLTQLGFSPEPNDTAGTPEQKKSTLRWLSRMKKNGQVPHPVLLAQLRLRGWITELKYDSFFPDHQIDEDD